MTWVDDDDDDDGVGDDNGGDDDDGGDGTYDESLDRGEDRSVFDLGRMPTMREPSTASKYIPMQLNTRQNRDSSGMEKEEL